MNKKIVLIKPRNEALDIYYDLPLGLLQVGTLPKKEGYHVKIIDCVLIKNYLEIIEKECKDAFVVGITLNTAQVREAIKISDFIKKRFNIPIVWGGWHPTLFPEQTCADASVDFVVIKEGDYVFLELVRAIDLKLPFDEIKGIVYKKDGVPVKTAYREDLNLDKIFPTDYKLVDFKQYVRNRNGIVTMIYQSSRGCPYNCQFCINAVTKNQKYRSKSAEKVIDEVEFLVINYGINYIGFIDDNTFVDIARIRRICEGFIERKLNVKWYGECRANYFRDGFVDKNLLDLAVKSGLSGLTVGSESGSERILKMMDKDITTEQILNSAKILGQYRQIVPVYGFILGLPGETKEDIHATLAIIKKIRALCPQMDFGIGTLRCYPKSGLTKDLVDKGFIKEPKSLRDWLQDRFIQMYIGENNKPWIEDQRFINDLAFYSALGYATFSETDRKESFRSPRRWHILIELPFVYLARLRMDNMFFFFPIDRFIYKLYKKMRRFAVNTFFIKRVKP